MNLQNRIDLLSFLGEYLKQNTDEWQSVKKEASAKNPWFTEAFIHIATKNIVEKYLSKSELETWAHHYHLDDLIIPKQIGIVMAGNIPMVGFHDFLSVFISGHKQTIKLSSKDDVLLKFLIEKLYQFEPQTAAFITIAENLKGCDAYIATGSNQSANHFEQYFGKYPSIIRRNKTSVAVLTGSETNEELESLSKDIHYYFGLGCRNVTKFFVPEDYDFIPLLASFHQFKHFRDFMKYSNNYDFQLSLLLLNNVKYMSNETTLLVENENYFSPISVLFYEFYKTPEKLTEKLSQSLDLQCIVGNGYIPFGNAQTPDLFSYADGIDTMEFLLTC
ncbi:MAG: acyl-CoA reductase [Bacteroidota bacterium]